MSPATRFSALTPAFVLILALAPVAARADWFPNGNPFATLSQVQNYPTVAPDGAGGAFVAWSEGLSAGVQRITGSGALAAGWPAEGFPARHTDDYHRGDEHPVVVSDGEGGAYVVVLILDNCVAHCGVDPRGIWVQRLTSEGHFAPGWPAGGVAVAPNNWRAEVDRRIWPRVVPDGHHGVLIAWQAYWGWGLVSGPIYAQSIASDGSRRWGDNGLLVCDAAGTESHPEIIPDGKRGAFVFWCGNRPSDPGDRVFGQHVTASGEPLWDANGVPISASYTMRYIVEAFSWRMAPPTAIPDDAHGAIVAWAGSRGADLNVYATRVTHGGGLPWRHEVPVCAARGDQFDMQMVPPPGGGAIVVWLDSRRDSALDIRAQRLRHGGQTAWTRDGVPVCTAPGNRGLLTTVGDGSDGAYVAWGDRRSEGALFALRLTGEGMRARGWPTDGALVCDRPRTASSVRQVLSLDMADVDGHRAILVWQDFWEDPNHLRRAGTSHAMLLTREGPAASPAPTTIVHPPAQPVAQAGPSGRPAFALRGARPNPGPRGSLMRFVLPDAAPAILELFDVAGRRLWSREVGSLGPGEHEVGLGDEALLPPGLYLARLTQGDHTATARVAIVR